MSVGGRTMSNLNREYLDVMAGKTVVGQVLAELVNNKWFVRKGFVKAHKIGLGNFRIVYP